MTDQHQHSAEVGNEASTKGAQPTDRRRFVRGAALGVPAVLTLHSGGLAALSLPCSARAQNQIEIQDNPEGSCAMSTI